VSGRNGPLNKGRRPTLPLKRQRPPALPVAELKDGRALVIWLERWLTRYGEDPANVFNADNHEYTLWLR
jgi:hypothetical protein